MAKELNTDIKALGERIDTLRKEKGYTIRGFAKLCGISKSQINELSNDGVDFRYSTLLKIAKGLDVSISTLLTL